MDTIDIIKNSIIEYIEILISIAIEKKQDEYVQRLDIIKEHVNNANTYDELKILKRTVKEVDDELETIKKPLSSREQDLINRGYDEESVRDLCSFTKKEFDEKKNILIDRLTKKCIRVEDPECIYLGGQPGSGKTTISRELRTNNSNKTYVDISLDNYRSYHPHYLEIEELIKKHWENRTETEDDTKGNDIADFTHTFASNMSDALLEEISKKYNNKAYNIVLEWGMRTPEAPLKTMHELKEKGYNNIVKYIVVHKSISKEACKIRADVMNNFNHIIRRVPNYFHEICINTLPSSAQTIYNIGYQERHDISSFNLIDRKNNIIWDQHSNKNLKQVYEQYLNNRELSTNFSNDEQLAEKSYSEEQTGFKKEVDEMFVDDDDENFNQKASLK